MSRTLRDAIRNFFAWFKYAAARLDRFRRTNFVLSERNWRWITASAVLVLLLFMSGYLGVIAGDVTGTWLIVALILFIIFPLMVGAMIKTGIKVASRIPSGASWLLFAAGAIFFVYFSFSFKALLVLLFYMLFTFVFIFGALSNISSQNWKSYPRFKKLVNVFFLTIGSCNLLIATFFLAYPGPPVQASEDFSFDATSLPEQLNADDPSMPGPFETVYMTYGAGTDRYREEFAGEADMVSGSVDGSAFIDGWDKLAGKLRTLYWGFGPDSLPLNGRIWMPEGSGPFPVVLIVHGNHFDRDFSDAGYEYLGEHLASHGFMTVSADQNFLNHGMTNFSHSLSEENDARGWILLKHLELIREWGEDPGSPLYRKTDIGNVILVGHSRGGEAVNIAACFNQLPFYPEDASREFEFDFGIRGIVAIAQVDGQYKPANRPTPLQNVNYLSLQGSMDADLESYSGLAQMNRIRFTDSVYHFKAGLYIENANHGQFNTSWGDNDVGFPNGMLLNRRRLLSGEDQQQVALVYITAFAKASIGNHDAYLPLMADYRTGAEWLPSTRFVNQFMDNSNIILADYEEDIDLTTGSLPGVQIRFSHLAVVSEQDAWLNKGQIGSSAVCIGWNNAGYQDAGTYSITLPHGMVLPDSLTSLRIDVTGIDEDPGDRFGAMDEEEQDMMPDQAKGAENAEQQDDGEETDPTAIGFNICLVDAQGDSAIVSTLDHFPVSPPVVPHIYKLKIFGGEGAAEPIPQFISVGTEHFTSRNPSLDLRELRSIHLVFDQGEKGMLYIDNIGFQTKYYQHL